MKGFDYNFQVPNTGNNKLKLSMKTNLEDISNKKILISQTTGNKVINLLRKSNPFPAPRCHRVKCKPCHHGLKNSKCFQNNIGYRIICNRPPCNLSIKTTLKDLQTDNWKIQLSNITEKDHKPATYEGESHRNLYNRMNYHWAAYTTVSGKQKSFMYHHTGQYHNGIIGQNRGEDDYKCILLEKFQSTMDRLIDEGHRQTIMEKFQMENKVIVLNSKIDFVQPMRTQLSVINKAVNSLPGHIDKFQPAIRLTNNKLTANIIDRKIVTAKRRLQNKNNINKNNTKSEININKDKTTTNQDNIKKTNTTNNMNINKNKNQVNNNKDDNIIKNNKQNINVNINKDNNTTNHTNKNNFKNNKVDNIMNNSKQNINVNTNKDNNTINSINTKTNKPNINVNINKDNNTTNSNSNINQDNNTIKNVDKNTKTNVNINKDTIKTNNTQVFNINKDLTNSEDKTTNNINNIKQTKTTRKYIKGKRRQKEKPEYEFKPQITSTPEKLPKDRNFATNMSMINWVTHTVGDVLVHNISDRSNNTEFLQNTAELDVESDARN